MLTYYETKEAKYDHGAATHILIVFDLNGYITTRWVPFADVVAGNSPKYI